MPNERKLFVPKKEGSRNIDSRCMGRMQVQDMLGYFLATQSFGPEVRIARKKPSDV